MTFFALIRVYSLIIITVVLTLSHRIRTSTLTELWYLFLSKACFNDFRERMPHYATLACIDRVNAYSEFDFGMLTTMEVSRITREDPEMGWALVAVLRYK